MSSDGSIVSFAKFNSPLAVGISVELSCSQIVGRTTGGVQIARSSVVVNGVEAIGIRAVDDELVNICTGNGSHVLVDSNFNGGAVVGVLGTHCIRGFILVAHDDVVPAAFDGGGEGVGGRHERSHISSLVHGDEVGVDEFFVAHGKHLEVGCTGFAFILHHIVRNDVAFTNSRILFGHQNLNPFGFGGFCTFGIIILDAKVVHVADGQAFVCNGQSAIVFVGIFIDRGRGNRDGSRDDRACTVLIKVDVAQSHIAADFFRVDPLDVADVFAQVVE